LSKRCTVEEFTDLLINRTAAAVSTYVVVVSGFGGAGKSTFAAQLAQRVDGAVALSADDFIVDQQRERCDDWRSVDRFRLREQVLVPIRAGQSPRYQRYDWPTNALAEWHDLDLPAVLIVEGIGVVHPDLMPFFDASAWIDMPLEVANERGRRRDKDEYGVDHDVMWRDLWTPNDRDYFERFRPDDLADFVVEPAAD
jgi:uridine kinase